MLPPRSPLNPWFLFIETSRNLRVLILCIKFPYFIAPTQHFTLRESEAQGGDFNDFYPDVCVEGLEKDPF